MSVFTSENIKIPPHKMESYLKFTKIIQWGRKNPVHFVSRFFGIDLLDYQKYVFMSSWYAALLGVTMLDEQLVLACKRLHFNSELVARAKKIKAKSPMDIVKN
jgi:hypothetical protein